MPTLLRDAGGFRLASSLPRHIERELDARGLPQPWWDKSAHAWRLADETAAYLTETRAVAGDPLPPSPPVADRQARMETALRPYQRRGVDFMVERKRVLLADGMGLGKTLQALAAIEESGAYRAVVVCPSAVKTGWEREVLRWLPWRSTQILNKGSDTVLGRDVTILNPELLARHVEALKDLGVRCLVLDEAHFFKNPASQRSRLAMELAQGVPMRLALTGTPIKNRREDLVHQLRLLGQLEEVLHIFRGILPHWWTPDMGPLQEAHAVQALDRLDRKTLNDRLRQVCMMRRTKHQVAKDLPPFERTRIDVAPQRSAAYKQEEAAMLDWVRKWKERFGAEADQAEALAEGGGALRIRAHLSRLRREAAMAKLPAAVEWAETLHGSGERVVFFAYHKAVVDALAKALPGKVATITGDTPQATRRTMLDSLDHYDFLVATMDATGYGVDGIQLHASHVAFIELDWTPTKHEQCEGRLHRIGQRDHVNAWYFVATNTIDKDMMGVLEAKWLDIQGVVGSENAGEEAFLMDLVRRVAGISSPDPQV